jgi:hypothetical protein
LLYTDSRFIEDLTQSSRTNNSVVGHNDTRIWVVASKNDMASALAIYDKPDTQKHPHQFLAG